MQGRGDRLEPALVKSGKRSSSSPALVALLSAALFGAATPASKALLHDASPFQLAGLLYLGAAIAMVPLVFARHARRLPRHLSPVNKLRLVGAVVFGGLFGPVFLLVGLQKASAASVSMWLNLEMVATAMLGLLFFKDHLGTSGWIGVAGVIAASCLLSLGQDTAGLWAGLLVGLACLCWGLDNHFTALIDGLTPAQSTLCKGSVAGLVNLGLGVWLAPFEATVLETSLAILVGTLSYGVSIALYIYSAQQVGATRAQMVFASAPFFGVLLSALVLRETVSPVQFMAAGMLAASVVMLFRDRHHHTHTHEPVAHEHSHRHDDLHHTHEHPNQPASLRHSHWHEHEELTHLHPHWPDLHHRHRHD
jgi:drug/metabolite transporter (DMT)-like permease